MHAGQSCLGISYTQGSWDDKHLQLRGWDLRALSLRGLGDESNRSGWPSQSKSIKSHVSVGKDPPSGFVRAAVIAIRAPRTGTNEIWGLLTFTHMSGSYSRILWDIYTHFYIIFQCVTWRICTAVSMVHVCHVAQLGKKSLGPSNVLVDYKSAYKLYHRQISDFLKIEV